MEAIVGIVVGIVVGAAVAWLAIRLKTASQVAVTEQRLTSADQESARLRADVQRWQEEASERGRQVASLHAQLDSANKRLAEQTDIERTLGDKFSMLASDVMAKNNERFFTVADEKIGTLVKPLSEELRRIETVRAQSQGSLTEQIASLASSNKALELETRNLSTALKAPQRRGRWGEIQLRRVAELAGMIDHCDFREQVSIKAEDGTTDRPDMVVYMPSDRTIVVDAKTPLNAYLESVESQTDDEREAALEKHASQVKERANSLSRTAYWNSLDRSPDFVVMFLPGEFFLQPALERDPELLERAMQERVVIATPSTLMALLRTVEMGWREAKLAEDAAQIGRLGQELHDRLSTFANHMNRMGGSLSSAVGHFNSGVGSLERRVFPTARQFKELGVSSSQDITELSEIDSTLRRLPSSDTGADKPLQLTIDD